MNHFVLAPAVPSLHVLQSGFLSILPRVERHARITFRHIRCAHSRADAIAETVALCWIWYVRLALRGKEATAFVSALVNFAVRQVRCGRGLCGQESTRDALSPTAQLRRKFVTQSLPVCKPGVDNPLAEALHDNTATPVPEQVAFRIDFPRWRRSRAPRQRHLIDRLMAGERTNDLARQFGVSPARISQLRRALHTAWQEFCDCTIDS